eukprot:CAMPEP_0194370902 /NCGR_PEP_ID=MMETSP0174-20130528/19245_1 /TAXON_ID=216777 /ORGANISM="Proboscia alata, Strain PI-D3" /LENGTH=72 /DNA_ID=CAMNT_0039148631 /DNA_START=15 /DNA_END=230 /DNA_ORIENTATION=+
MKKCNQDQWDLQYKELARYMKEFCHTPVPKNYPENPGLPRWIWKQRANYRKFQKGDFSHEMSVSRIECLNKL